MEKYKKYTLWLKYKKVYFSNNILFSLHWKKYLGKII